MSQHASDAWRQNALENANRLRAASSPSPQPLPPCHSMTSRVVRALVDAYLRVPGRGL